MPGSLGGVQYLKIRDKIFQGQIPRNYAQKMCNLTLENSVVFSLLMCMKCKGTPLQDWDVKLNNYIFLKD